MANPTLERSQALMTAREIVDRAKAENRDLTADEVKTCDEALDRVKSIDQRNASAAAAAELIKRVGEIDPSFEVEPNGYLPSAKAAFARSAAKAAEKRTGEFGLKALIGGTIDVPALFSEVIPLPQAPNSVLDLIPKRTVGEGDGEFGANSFTWLQQVTRTNNANAIADAGQKPTSVYTWSEYQDRVRVYAHISDPVPERFLSDYRNLIQLLQSEMADGILRKLGYDVLNGPASPTAPADNFRGILNTSGIQTQAAVTGDLLQTLSNGWFKLVSQGDTPTAWVMNPADYQKLTLLRESGSTGALMFGSGRSTLTSVIGEAPIVTTPNIPAGTALVGDFSQTVLAVRQNAMFEADKSGTLFDTNQVRFRLEGRYGFAVQRPLSFVKITLP